MERRQVIASLFALLGSGAGLAAPTQAISKNSTRSSVSESLGVAPISYPDKSQRKGESDQSERKARAV